MLINKVDIGDQAPNGAAHLSFLHIAVYQVGLLGEGGRGRCLDLVVSAVHLIICMREQPNVVVLRTPEVPLTCINSSSTRSRVVPRSS